MHTTQKLAVTVATAVTLVVNALSAALPLNGRTPGEISDLYPSDFTPAGYVFSIWGLIYLGLVAYTVWQWRASGTAASRAQSVAWPYVASACANVAWIFCWHWLRIGLAMLAMLVLLASLATIYARLRAAPPASFCERAALDATFSVYFGWICVATLANLSVLVLATGGWPPALGPAGWAMAMLAAAAAVFLGVGLRRRDPVFMAVFLWAAVGIAARESQRPAVAALAWAAAGLVAAALLYVVVRDRRHGVA